MAAPTKPATTLELPITRPTLGDEEAAAVAEVLRSGWVTQGPRVAAFEGALAGLVGARHACATCNCTTALHLALMAVGTRPGDVVITVSHSFIATANSVRACGAEPVFVDVDLSTFNLDPASLAATLERDFERRDGGLWYRDVDRLAVGESPLCHKRPPIGRLAAILVVHQVGMPADLPAILPVAERAGVPVVEDAACAIGSELSLDGGRSFEPVGRPHGAVAALSFHPRKVITTGEGGMLTSRSSGHDELFRLLRHHGMSVSDVARHSTRSPVVEAYVTTAFNYRMTDIQAAVGLVQLARLPAILAARRELARLYEAALAGLPVELPRQPAYARSNWQSYVVLLPADADQARVMVELGAKGIASRAGIMCSHLERPYRDAWRGRPLPQSEAARARGLCLPFFPGMTDEDVDRVALALSDAL